MWKREWYPSSEIGVYMAALDALEAEGRSLEGVWQLHESIPLEDPEALVAVKSMWSSSMAPRVLDPCKMRELREREPELHSRIAGYHQRWLAAQLFG